MNAARRASWVVGWPLRAVLIRAIRLYRLTLSHALGNQCRFSPSCSHYGEEAIRSRGAIVGSGLALWRVLRCNPFGRGGHDPVPPRRHDFVYEPVIPRVRHDVETSASVRT